MKLLIEIPEEAKQAFDCAESNDIKGSFYDHGGVIGNAIRNGTPIPDNATNGDVIMAMFSNLEIEYTDIDEYTNKPRYVKLIVGDTIITRMSADRWNAPYKEEHDANDS